MKELPTKESQNTPVPMSVLRARLERGIRRQRIINVILWICIVVNFATAIANFCRLLSPATEAQEPETSSAVVVSMPALEAAENVPVVELEPEKVVVVKCRTLPVPEDYSAEASEEVSEPSETVSEPTSEPASEYVTDAGWKSLGTYTLTAYCSCEKCCGYWATIRPKDENGNPIVYTATGTVAEQGRTIAVDPTVIPYGSKVKIGETVYIAEDCGGAIKGNRIDVYHSNHGDALVFGRWDSEVFIEIE